MALLAGLDPCLLDGVDLQEAIEVSLITPGPLVVIVADLPGGGVDDNRVGPIGQPDDEPGGRAAEEPGSAGERHWQFEAPAGGANRRMIADLGLDGDDV